MTPPPQRTTDTPLHTRAEKQAAFDASSAEMALVDVAAEEQAESTVDLTGMRAGFDANKETALKFMLQHVMTVAKTSEARRS